MMAMRYGTLPLVHEVGGLRDTVKAFNPIEGSGTGFSFDNLSPYWLIGLSKQLWTCIETILMFGEVYKNKLWSVISHGIQPASHTLTCTIV